MPGTAAEIGPIIRDLRRNRGWNQTRLAEISGVGISTVGRLENGHGGVFQSTAARIFDAFRDHPPGLRKSQARKLAIAGRLDPGLADDPRIKDDRQVSFHEKAQPILGHRLEMLTELLSRVTAESGSPDAATDLLELLILAGEQWLNKHIPGHINQPPEGPEEVTSRDHPPVERDGYTEQFRGQTIRRRAS